MSVVNLSGHNLASVFLSKTTHILETQTDSKTFTGCITSRCIRWKRTQANRKKGKKSKKKKISQRNYKVLWKK